MKQALLIPSAVFAMLSAAPAPAADPAIASALQRMMDVFNKGDIGGIKALHAPAPTIVDNVPPFRWAGPDAVDNWIGSLTEFEGAEGKSDGKVTFGAPVHEIVNGQRAYVVSPSTYTFRQSGQTMRESGLTTFTFVKAGAEWKVESWSWASPAAVAEITRATQGITSGRAYP